MPLTDRDISAEVEQARRRFSIVGLSPALNLAIERAIRVAPIDLSVLVTGESGSGKEFFPKIIHNFGARKHAKYIAVNCGAIPEGTIDSELFGHEKGAFTGALSTRKGYFEEADGGTIFLDEVAELPLTTQARLLRVLETGEFLKVGSSQVQRADVRVVAATNVDLVRAVAEGRFREDLYYRLSTVQIHVPPLRDRGRDILLLARKFAADFSEKYLTEPIDFSEDARRLLLLYSWPGNVRQLKNVVDQASLFSAGSTLDAATLRSYLPQGSSMGGEVACSEHTPSYDYEREMLWKTIVSMQHEIRSLRAKLEGGEAPLMSAAETDSDIPRHRAMLPAPETPYTPYSPMPDDLPAEALMIRDALSRAGGNRKRAAATLGISERTLYRKIKEYGLSAD
ncbi:MAG: sigma-54 dependent transcriptional regulator [Muribaculaceae bacterium]|nr:sigma-54 dependent transcriptional regulator [Muribaculaceae bacterium]